MFQQHHGESLSKAWTRFKDLLQKVPHHGIDLWLQVQIFYDHVNLVTRRTIDQSAGGKLRDLNAEESWALLEDLALYDNESWNDPRDFAKPVKAITLPQDVLRTSDRRLIELKNQVQRLMEAYLAPTQPTQRERASHPTNACDTTTTLDWSKGKEEVKEQGTEENEIKTDVEEEEEEVIEEEESEFETDEEVEEILKEEEDDENFNSFPTMKDLTHHEWLLKNPRPLWIKARIRAGSPNNIKISCMAGSLCFKEHT
ncbi:hypothetical protein Tco_1427686 [Tanacetum coccineum]